MYQNLIFLHIAKSKCLQTTCLLKFQLKVSWMLCDFTSRMLAFLPIPHPQWNFRQWWENRELFVWKSALNIMGAVDLDPNCILCLVWRIFVQILLWLYNEPSETSEIKPFQIKIWVLQHKIHIHLCTTSLCLFFIHLIKVTWGFFCVQNPAAQIFLLISLRLLQAHGKPRQNIFLQKGFISCHLKSTIDCLHCNTYFSAPLSSSRYGRPCKSARLIVSSTFNLRCPN